MPFQKGYKMTESHRRNIILGLQTRKKRKIGWKLSKEARQKMSISRTGTGNSMWKGNKVGYRGIHTWLNRQIGKPTTCQNCKRTNLTGHAIHWANISKKYKRDITDWIRLCVKCHINWDRNNIIIKT